MKEFKFYQLHPRAMCHGFTLVELIIALVIGGILFGLAMPNLRALITNNDIATETNSLVADLNLARSEAVKRVTAITVCKSTDAGNASPTCATTGNNWAIGHVVFIDADGNGKVSTGDTVLRTSTGAARNITINAGSNLTTTVVFNPDGSTTLARPKDATKPAENQFKICDPQRGAGAGRVVTVSNIGRISVDKSPLNCG